MRGLLSRLENDGKSPAMRSELSVISEKSHLKPFPSVGTIIFFLCYAFYVHLLKIINLKFIFAVQ